MAEAIPEELLEKLWSDPEARSRNKNFARFRDDRIYRLAVHHIKALLSLRDDLITYRDQCSVVVKRLAAGKAAQIMILIPLLRFRRSLFVSKLELELLQSDPAWSDVEIRIIEDAPTDHDRRE